ncbi:ammonium transporter [Microcystis sp. MC19]|uniref:ammonium transporter n=1 Tax=Microcystis sp. MC19 TaxID=1967666 RepID=UPI001C1F3B4B|nr:ammonium transporter [Microcystis sp. MC19]
MAGKGVPKGTVHNPLGINQYPGIRSKSLLQSQIGEVFLWLSSVMKIRQQIYNLQKGRGRWLAIGKYCLFFGVTVSLLLVSHAVMAQDSDSNTFSPVDTIWLITAGALVFFMNAGFALLEAGSCSQKSLINVLAKNVVVFCIATLAYLIGFKLMFGDGLDLFQSPSQITCPISDPSKILSVFGRFGLIELPFSTWESGSETGNNPLGFPSSGFSCLKELWPNRSFASIFFFQLVFAGTAATIVSGAVAERIKFIAFCLFSLFLVAVIYPVVGHWVWGPYGWLSQLKFRDFAGSAVVHSVGGTAALVGAWILGPRWTCKFKENDKSYDPQEDIDIVQSDRYYAPPEYQENLKIAHNPGFVTLGAFILWLGWIGFNGGSTPNLSYIGHIVVTTLIASAAGGIASIISTPFFAKSDPTLGNFINGILGGLVAITASSAYVGIKDAIIIGFVGGLLIIIGELIILPNVLKIDDPVGAISVHLMGGLWGTIAVGMFADPDSLVYKIEINNLLDKFKIFGVQFIGALVIFLVTGVLSLISWIVLGLLIFQFESFGEKKITITGTISWWKTLLLRARYGLRLSVEDEYVGTYKMFSDPERSSRETELKKYKI